VRRATTLFELYPLDSEIVIAAGKGAILRTEIARLAEIRLENLLVCGVTTEVCVNTTVPRPTTAATAVVIWTAAVLLSRISEMA